MRRSRPRVLRVLEVGWVEYWRSKAGLNRGALFALPQVTILGLLDQPGDASADFGAAIPGLHGLLRHAQLRVPGSHGERKPRGTASAQVFEQQNHLVVLVFGAARGAARPSPLELRDPLGQFRAGAAAFFGGFQDARAEKLGNELKLVGREAHQEPPGLGFQRTISTRN